MSIMNFTLCQSWTSPCLPLSQHDIYIVHLSADAVPTLSTHDGLTRASSSSSSFPQPLASHQPVRANKQVGRPVSDVDKTSFASSSSTKPARSVANDVVVKQEAEKENAKRVQQDMKESEATLLPLSSSFLSIEDASRDAKVKGGDQNSSLYRYTNTLVYYMRIHQPSPSF